MALRDARPFIDVAILHGEFNAEIVFVHRDSTVKRVGDGIIVVTPPGAGTTAATFPRLRLEPPASAGKAFIVRVLGACNAGAAKLALIGKHGQALVDKSVTPDQSFTLDLVCSDLTTCGGVAVINGSEEPASLRIDAIDAYAILGIPRAPGHPAPRHGLKSDGAFRLTAASQ